MKSNQEPLKFLYKNWKGEESIRHVVPVEMFFGDTDFHKETQWFLKAYDISKLDMRDFAVKDIIKFL